MATKFIDSTGLSHLISKIKAAIPTKTSQLSNDSGFLTSHQTIKQDGITGATVNRFGTCGTAAGTAAKTVNISTGTFSLEAGSIVAVKFSNANSASSPTLNVNSTGAKNIFVNGGAITTSAATKSLLKGTVIFVYDGTQYHLIGNYYNSDTNSWRAVNVNGTQLLGTGTGTGAVNFKSGTNTTVSGSGNDITINATDTVTTVTTTGSGNAVTAISATNGALTVTKGSTFSLSSHTHNYAGSASAGGPATNIAYQTTAPTANNTSGLKIAYLTSDPATKYSGWLYLIAE